MMSETEPAANETELETPIKFRWTGYARDRILGYNLDFDSEESDRVARTLDRQKTNVVVKTVEEAEALANEMDSYRNEGGEYGRTWVNGAIASACERVRSEVISGMRELGYVADASGLAVDFSEPSDDMMTPEGVVEQAHELISEHGGVEIANRGMTWTVTDPEDVEVAGNAVRVDGGAFSPGEDTEVTPVGGDDEDEDREPMTDGGMDVEALTELEAGEELTFQMDHETTGQVRELTGTVADHPYMDAHDDWMVVLKDVTRGEGPGAIRVAAGSPGSDGGHVIIYRDGSVESRPCASRQIHLGDIRAVVTPISPSEDPEPEVRADGGAELADEDSEFPTIGLDYKSASGIPNTSSGANEHQRRMVGSVFAGQVLVDMDAYEYERDRSAYDGYTGHTWEIASISEDSRWMTLRKRDGEDAGTERRLTVAAFAREAIRGERWMFLKDDLLANTWNSGMRGNPSHRCQNCGVTRDNALSREEHFTTTAGGREFRATLRRCVGCGCFGVEAHAKDSRYTGRNHFTTGILEGPEPPWSED